MNWHDKYENFTEFEKSADYKKWLEENNVECNKHYPVPCHLQKAYAFLGYQPGDCPNAEYLASHCVTLPLFPEMTEEEVDRVIALCNAYGKE